MPFDLFSALLPKTGALEGVEEEAAEDILTKWGAEEQERVWADPSKFKPASIGSQANMSAGGSDLVPEEPLPGQLPIEQLRGAAEAVPQEGYDEETMRAALNDMDIEQAANDELYQTVAVTKPPR